MKLEFNLVHLPLTQKVGSIHESLQRKVVASSGQALKKFLWEMEETRRFFGTKVVW